VPTAQKLRRPRVTALEESPMSFFIRFHADEDEDGACFGSVSLGDDTEDFRTILDHFSRDQYEAQWRNALRIVLAERRPVALFTSVKLGDDGLGRVWLFPIIPSELAGERVTMRPYLRDFPEPEDAGVYVCAGFRHVTVTAANFEKRIYLEFVDGTRGEDLSLYFLDLATPERFFGYLDHDVVGISHWYHPNSELQAFLST
jgi:hypothetical protein